MRATTVRDSLEPLAGRIWWRACSFDDIPEDEGLLLDTVPKTSVFLAEGELFCIDDTCTHEDFSLAQGWIDGCVVECTLHAAKFDLRTGSVLSPPACVPVATHPVTRLQDDVYIALPEAYLVKEDSDGLA